MYSLDFNPFSAGSMHFIGASMTPENKAALPRVSPHAIGSRESKIHLQQIQGGQQMNEKGICWPP